MGEKNILAYFHSPEEAEGVRRKMEALRAIATSVDRIGRFPGEGNDQIVNPINSDFPGLGSLVLDADFSHPSAGILAAADVTASGMSDGGQEAITGRDVLLTVVIDEDHYDKALEVIRQAGGLV